MARLRARQAVQENTKWQLRCRCDKRETRKTSRVEAENLRDVYAIMFVWLCDCVCVCRWQEGKKKDKQQSLTNDVWTHSKTRALLSHRCICFIRLTRPLSRCPEQVYCEMCSLRRWTAAGCSWRHAGWDKERRVSPRMLQEFVLQCIQQNLLCKIFLKRVDRLRNTNAHVPI